MVGRVAAPLVVLALIVAGCSGPGAGGDGGGPTANGFTVDGVVVSSAIVPLAGVAVALQPVGAITKTDAEGRFSFAGLAVGAYTVQAHRAGFLDAAVNVEVPSARIVQLVLEADRIVGVFYEAFVFDGFIEQSFNVAGARGGTDAGNYTIGRRQPDLIQSELVWESTQSLGSNLDLTAIANDGNLTKPAIGEADGPSPLLLVLNSSVIEEFRLGPQVRLDFAVFAGAQPVAADTGVGLAVSQPYRLITHMFYGFLPPDGWRFTTDGDPPLPR